VDDFEEEIQEILDKAREFMIEDDVLGLSCICLIFEIVFEFGFSKLTFGFRLFAQLKALARIL
tara:strand:+ start:2871 stop:3059 length:189 start_codon:yes stop_codon:yes gene_type:complete